VPVRFVSEALGCNVGWDNDTQTANIAKGGTWVDVAMDSKNPVITDVDSGNKTTVTIDAPAMLINGRTMVPLRFVSEALKANVSWKSPEQTGTGKGRVDVFQDNSANELPGNPAGEVRHPLIELYAELAGEQMTSEKTAKLPGATPGARSIISQLPGRGPPSSLKTVISASLNIRSVGQYGEIRAGQRTIPKTTYLRPGRCLPPEQ